MWVVFFNQLEDLESLSREKSYERFASHNNGVVYRSKRNDVSLLFAASENIEHQEFFDWVYKNFQPHAVISSGILRPASEDSKLGLIVPVGCFRAAGRVDAASPILYEELNFDPSLQEKMGQLFNVPVESHIFSAEKPVGTEDRIRICQHLPCAAFAQLAGPHLLMGKSRGLRVGCVKTILPPNESRKNAIKELLGGFLTLNS